MEVEGVEVPICWNKRRSDLFFEMDVALWSKLFNQRKPHQAGVDEG